MPFEDISIPDPVDSWTEFSGHALPTHQLLHLKQIYYILFLRVWNFSINRPGGR